MKKLNVGSGEFLKEGFVNVDFYSVSEPDVKHDSNERAAPNWQKRGNGLYQGSTL